jgi:hypothetical protein
MPMNDRNHDFSDPLLKRVRAMHFEGRTLFEITLTLGIDDKRVRQLISQLSRIE